jgi:uncharacterized membrane protein YeiB
MVDAPAPVVGEQPAPALGAPAKARFLGVDVTRGIALVTMIAANAWEPLGSDGSPTVAGMTVIGRAATLFVMVAGISLALITGGRKPVRGRLRRAARASIAVRALVIGAIGLALGYAASISVILPYYGLYFLLAIPLVGLGPRILACVVAGLVVISPLVLLASFSLGWGPAFDRLTLGSPFEDPAGFLTQLFLTGDYPAVTNLAYLCAGLAIGRLDLSSTKVAVRLLIGGLALAVVTWVTSWFLVLHLGGLQHLIAAGAGTTRDQVVWDADVVPSWWWLALDVHHSGTPVNMLQTLGSAMAVLGAVLLVTRLPAGRRLLAPLGVAGAMTLTIYSAHAPYVASHLPPHDLLVRYLLIVGVALAFAVLWRRWVGQGPLERLVTMAADRARVAVLASPDRRAPAVAPPRAERSGPELDPPAREGVSR